MIHGRHGGGVAPAEDLRDDPADAAPELPGAGLAHTVAGTPPRAHRASPDASSLTGALSVSSTVFLTRFYMPLRSDPSSTYTMFADAARAHFVSDLLFSRWKSYDGTRAVFRYAVVNIRKKLCVTSVQADVSYSLV